MGSQGEDWDPRRRTQSGLSRCRAARALLGVLLLQALCSRLRREEFLFIAGVRGAPKVFVADSPCMLAFTRRTKLLRSVEPEDDVVARRAAAIPALTRIKHALHLGIAPSVWKEKWVGPANLDRVNLRMAAMDTYALVASVVLLVIVGLYGGIPEPADDDPRIRYPKLQRIFYEVQMLLLMFATFFSTYTMVTTLLCKVYMLMALSMYKDIAYAVFQVATEKFRNHGFWTLIASMVTCLVAFSMNLFTRIKGKRGLVTTAVVLSMGVLILADWVDIVDLAAKLISKAS